VLRSVTGGGDVSLGWLIQSVIHVGELLGVVALAMSGAAGSGRTAVPPQDVSGRTSGRTRRSTSRGSRCSRVARKTRSGGMNQTFSPCSFEGTMH
jgi:hypothetical protein